MKPEFLIWNSGTQAYKEPMREGGHEKKNLFFPEFVPSWIHYVSGLIF
jgi:hypothetical protein